MINRTLLSGVTVCLGLMDVFADLPTDTAIPLPVAPFVSEPVPGTKWRVAIKYPDIKASDTPISSTRENSVENQRPDRIETHCGISGSRITVKNSLGAILCDGFVIGNRLFKLNPGTGSVSIVPSDEGNFASPVFVRSYQGSEWVTMETYQGVDKIGKEACYKFMKPAQVVSDPSEGFSHPELTVWIQVVNKIPVLFRIGDVVYSYSAIEPADADIFVPPEIRKLNDKINREQKALSAMRRR